MYRLIASAVLATSVFSLSLHAGIAQTRPSDVQWSGKAGEQLIQVPAGDKPTVMLFVRADQRQSDDVLEQAARLLPAGTAHAVAVYSGPLAQQQAQQASGKLPFSTVADTDYSLSGKMGVHVWPTTVMVNPKGDVMAHIAGVNKSYGLEFSGSLDFLAGKIDRAAFDARMNDRTVVTDNPAQAAARHLQMAQRMIAKDRLEDAAAEIASGLKLQPENGQLQLAQIRVLVLQGKLDDAVKVLENLKPGSVPAPQLALARGRVLSARGELDMAISSLEEAIKLNPNPSEAQYELGLIYQKQGQFEKAASALRSAYEARD